MRATDVPPNLQLFLADDVAVAGLTPFLNKT
jgi:hypothetical protein